MASNYAKCLIGPRFEIQIYITRHDVYIFCMARTRSREGEERARAFVRKGALPSHRDDGFNWSSFKNEHQHSASAIRQTLKTRLDFSSSTSFRVAVVVIITSHISRHHQFKSSLPSSQDHQLGFPIISRRIHLAERDSAKREATNSSPHQSNKSNCIPVFYCTNCVFFNQCVSFVCSFNHFQKRERETTCESAQQPARVFVAF